MFDDIIVIAINGKIGSGKNYIVENVMTKFVPDNLPYSIIGFADQIKYQCCVQKNFTHHSVFEKKTSETRIALQTIGMEGRDLSLDYWVSYVDNYIKLTPTQRNKQRIISVFQEIDALGNYSDHTWFTTLTLYKLFIFIRELADIWNYRAQIPAETKLNICPPIGDPFRNTDMLIIRQMSYDSLQRFSLSCIENLVKMGVNNEYKSLGAIYVLTALTLVSENAATSMPWLYQSVAHIP